MSVRAKIRTQNAGVFNPSSSAPCTAELSENEIHQALLPEPSAAFGDTFRPKVTHSGLAEVLKAICC